MLFSAFSPVPPSPHSVAPDTQWIYSGQKKKILQLCPVVLKTGNTVTLSCLRTVAVFLFPVTHRAEETSLGREEGVCLVLLQSAFRKGPHPATATTSNSHMIPSFFSAVTGTALFLQAGFPTLPPQHPPPQQHQKQQLPSLCWPTSGPLHKATPSKMAFSEIEGRWEERLLAHNPPPPQPYLCKIIPYRKWEESGEASTLRFSILCTKHRVKDYWIESCSVRKKDCLPKVRVILNNWPSSSSPTSNFNISIWKRKV